MSKKDKLEKEILEEEVITKAQEESKKEEEKEVDPIETLQNDFNREKDRNLRLFAEFENFKKRTAKEKIDLYKTASEGLMTAILPVLDDFDRALLEIEKSKDNDHYKGVALINNKLKETLKSKGLTIVETAIGDVFDADNHEAITQIPSPSKDLKGKIVDVVEKGYRLGDKIIRFPKVVIGQ